MAHNELRYPNTELCGSENQRLLERECALSQEDLDKLARYNLEVIE